MGALAPEPGNAILHEMSIAQSLLDIVKSEASNHDINKVVRINIVAGELRGIVPAHLNYFFQFVSKDTIAEGAELNVQILPVKARCAPCNLIFEVEEYNYQCPRCKNNDVETVQGLELMVQDFEVC
jgi:hydrogenase nickel incorporation protein HypA/HybF